MTDEELAACEAAALQAADLHDQFLAWALQAVPERACKECVALDDIPKGSAWLQDAKHKAVAKSNFRSRMSCDIIAQNYFDAFI